MIPQEFTLGDVYLPPILIAAIFGVLASVISTKLLNRFGLAKYVFYPPLVFVALSVIYTVLFNILIPF